MRSVGDRRGRTSALDQRDDLLFVAHLVGLDRAMVSAQIEEHQPYVGGHGMVDAQQVGEVEAAIVAGIRPGEQEISARRA